MYAIKGLRQAVSRGANFMDERVPEWRTTVDANSLDMTDALYCVAGQVWGNYYDSPPYRGGIAVTHGFSTGLYSAGDFDVSPWAILRDLWLEELTRTPADAPETQES